MEHRSFTRSFLIEAGLVLLILLGVGFRFTHLTWHQGTNLHPDEYGLTNTLTQLSLPQTLDEYFNTRLSPLSPYQKYDSEGQVIAPGPDNRMRWGQWPITLLRWAGEITGRTGYDEIRVMGRGLSALADSLSLILLVLTGTTLYGRRIGLLAGSLSSLAVLQIQQSHFMTVDNFAMLFTMIALYAAVQVLGIRRNIPVSRTSISTLPWYLLFGAAFGMAMASRINLLPLAGIVVAAALIRFLLSDNEDRSRRGRKAGLALVFLAIAALASLWVFRITQPMSFRAETGDTYFWTLHLNPDWVDSMKVAQAESQGLYGGPPSEQWAHRPALVFPWLNIVLWGLGLPLGLCAWAGFAWAVWRALGLRPGWQAHILPLVWVGGYFLFMGTRWVKSVRYFLPIYPFLCLFAAWLLVELYERQVRHGAKPGSRSLAPLLPVLLASLVVFGTLTWATAFTRAVYLQEHTRLQATRWIWQNVPATFNLSLEGVSDTLLLQVPAHDQRTITPQLPFTQQFVASFSGRLESILVPYARALKVKDEFAPLQITISSAQPGSQVIGQAVLQVPRTRPGDYGGPFRAEFDGGELEQGQLYYLTASTQAGSSLSLRQAVIANDSWDETLPAPLDGRYMYGPVYRGIIMEVRWFDSEQKRQMFLESLEQADFIILPSQRAIWSSSRIPLTYPMTLEYYRALFDGRLGFDLAAHFTSPLEIGPLKISDVGGSIAWNAEPSLPLFNSNPFAAEEAFSVYDHPPVWIFQKRPDFDLRTAREILEAVDLEQVVIQSPREATWDGWLDLRR